MYRRTKYAIYYCSIRSYTFGKKVRGQDVGPIYVVSSGTSLKRLPPGYLPSALV